MSFTITFPADTDCGNLVQQYGSTLEAYAFEDYKFTQNPANKGFASGGTLQCYCTAKVGDGTAGTVTIKNQTNYDTICNSYNSLANKAFLLTESLSYVIVGVNTVIRTIMIMMITWIGYSSETVLLSKITTFTFLMLFFNTAFLLMLVNADMSE
jgi:hypothetical protein